MIGSISEMTKAKPDTSITTYNMQFYMYRRFIHLLLLLQPLMSCIDLFKQLEMFYA